MINGNFYLAIIFEQWSSWSICLAVCAGSGSDLVQCGSDCEPGERTRTRICKSMCDQIDENDPYRATIDRKGCNVEECCRPWWSEWESWSECYNNGKGPFQQKRQRHKCRGNTYDYEYKDCTKWGSGMTKNRNCRIF